jgi:hypothetical protein
MAEYLTDAPKHTFTICVPDFATGESRIVKTVLSGDVVTARNVLHMAVSQLRSLRSQNVNNLPQYANRLRINIQKADESDMNAPSGATAAYVVCSTNYGNEQIQIFAPLPTSAPIPTLAEAQQIVPAFEALDANGNLVGVVLCMSGTWSTPYYFVPIDEFSPKPDLSLGPTILNPFGYENWPTGGPTNSPTDAGLSWDGSVRPYAGNLKDILFAIDPTQGQLTDLVSDGEDLCTSNFTTTATPGLGTWTGSLSYNQEECGRCTTGGLPGTLVNATQSAPYQYIHEGLIFNNVVQNQGFDISLTASEFVESGIDVGMWWDVTVLSGGGICWPDASGSIPNPIVSIDTLNPAPCDPDGSHQQAGSPSLVSNITTIDYHGNTLIFQNEWSTITPKGFGLLFRQQNRNLYAVKGFNVNPDPCTWSTTRYGNFDNPNDYTSTWVESVLVDDNIFPTDPTVGPFTYPEGTFPPDNDSPSIVYPRYYRVGNKVYFLISVYRDSPTYGQRWQYGIYRSSSTPAWLFNVEFPAISSFGPHVIPGIKYKDQPVYCNGTFRLVHLHSGG